MWRLLRSRWRGGLTMTEVLFVVVVFLIDWRWGLAVLLALGVLE